MNAAATPVHSRPLGQILLGKGILSEDQLRIALLEQMKSNRPIGKLLVSLGFVSEAVIPIVVAVLRNRSGLSRRSRQVKSPSASAVATARNTTPALPLLAGVLGAVMFFLCLAQLGPGLVLVPAVACS